MSGCVEEGALTSALSRSRSLYFRVRARTTHFWVCIGVFLILREGRLIVVVRELLTIEEVVVSFNFPNFRRFEGCVVCE